MSVQESSVAPEIEALAKSMAESAPGAPVGAWYRMPITVRNRWRERATLAAIEYENTLASIKK